MKYVIKFLFIFFLFQNPVYAYIDPSNGSMLVQSLIATIATFLCFFKSIVRELKVLINKLTKRNGK